MNKNYCNYIEQNNAWEYMLKATEKDEELFQDVQYMRSNNVIITADGKLNFYHHVKGEIEDPSIKAYITDVKRGLYQKYGNRLVNLLHQAAKFIRD